MKLVPLNSIFDVKYGNQFDLEKMEPSSDGQSVNFVSRSSKLFGIVERVVELPLVKPFDAGLITVTLGGTYLLSSFVQPEKFYTAQNIKVLSPIYELSEAQKLYYCICIQHNRFRYSSHGREANTSLNTILVPDVGSIPAWVNKGRKSVDNLNKALLVGKSQLSAVNWKYIALNKIFKISASKDQLITKLTRGGTTPYISSTELNNGIMAFVDHLPTNPGNTITANRGGSIGEFFYQPTGYLATPVDVRILTPLFKMNKYSGLFIVSILRNEKFRFNYGRKMGTDRLEKLIIKLPVDKNDELNLAFMENYIKSLPYSRSI